MVILISGISCTGKTLMSQKLLEKYNIPYLSIDHIKMGLYRGDSNCGFTPLDSTERIGEKLWPIIKGIIMTNIENDQNIIIEGCYLLPQHIKDFEKAYSEKIISVFLGFSTNYIKENFTSNIVKHRNAVENRGFPEEGSVNEYINEHDAFRGKCLEYDVVYFEIDKNYEEEIIKVYDFIATQKRRIDSKLKVGDNN
ncbi:2-phosphoglycerate kinase [Paenibacillus sp. sptzw28]|uniref:2-phosphoglycerate kinase n=1 Tax=Paenibacillus sp. sptzw28 TaxID=715179 RepID=UPI001C6E5732|nr:2-phosphoglycerate kinase [Paenibacillus sp. sptzw28]QYR21264.1 2-phosphoglycerate kinase [Paenibacillus sp. sptzw28]